MSKLLSTRIIRSGLVLGFFASLVVGLGVVSRVQAQSQVLERFQSLQDALTATNTLSASDEAELAFGRGASALSNLRSMIPVVLYGEEIVLTEPTRSSVIAIGRSVEINAPILQDLYAITFDLTVNDRVFGNIAAVTNRATITVPNTMELHTPFSIGRLLWLDYVQPFSQTVMAERAERAAERERLKAEEEARQAEEEARESEGTTEEEVIEQNPEQTVMGIIDPRDGTPPANGLLNHVSQWRLVQPVMAQETEAITPTEAVVDASQSEPMTFASIDWDPVVSFTRSVLTTIVGIWVLLLVVPRFVQQMTSSLLQHPLGNIAWGFIGLIVVPVLAIVLLFTGLGWAISLVLFLLYGLGLLLATPVVAMATGVYLSQMATRQAKKDTKLWMRKPVVQAVLGAVVVSVLINIPMVGGWIGFLILMAGLGTGILWLRTGKTA